MNTKYNYHPTFKSRNSTIRFADDLVRKVNNEFPRFSITKLESFNNADKFQLLLSKLWLSTINMRDSIRVNFLESSDIKEKLEIIFNPIKDLKLGNCRESAQLSFVVAKANNIKNGKIAHLVSPEGYNYDHAVLLVNDKKPYIIDAWLGFADYVPNAIKRYQKEFRNCFDFEEANTEKMLVKEDFGLIQYFFNQEFKNRKNIKLIKENFPNLIKK